MTHPGPAGPLGPSGPPGPAAGDVPPANPPVVLAIEDEKPILRFLRATLAGHGYRLVEAVTGEEGLRQARARVPDLILLDLGLPDLDGLEVARRLREWSKVPIIVLSARGQERDKIAALDLGADDYVTKPFAVGELLARMRVALRHAARGGLGEGDTVVRVGDLCVDRMRRVVTLAGREVRLTPLEYRLLAALSDFPGRVLTHEHLLKQVWGPGYARQHHYLRVYMAQLRQKLERDPSRPEYLLTEPGVGYRMREE
ncbi:MAG: response regulator [Candidatus Eisenbacteria bacterium]|nr:response regulator [Candidatus Eisenbacteria bacterium]